MSEPSEIVPRGEQLLKTLEYVESNVNIGADIVTMLFNQLQAGAENVDLGTLINAISVNNLTHSYILEALSNLASRGFFDDNRMELTTEVLKQLGVTDNG